jgi:hypothetical protein
VRSLQAKLRSLFLPGLAIALGMTPCAAVAQPAAQDQAAQRLLKDVRLQWQGTQLVLYATFNKAGHDLPVFLAWRAAGDTSDHHGEIDYIEQYAQGMPLAITVVSLEKNAAGRDVLYVGQPRPNSPRIEDAQAVTVTGHIALDGDEDYAFTILPRAATAPELGK